MVIMLHIGTTVLVHCVMVWWSAREHLLHWSDKLVSTFAVDTEWKQKKLHDALFFIVRYSPPHVLRKKKLH